MTKGRGGEEIDKGKGDVCEICFLKLGKGLEGSSLDGWAGWVGGGFFFPFFFCKFL